jgi:hypothetical protein
MVAALIANDFSLDALAPRGTWAAEAQALEEGIKYYKRAGAGTEMSMSFTNRRTTRPKRSAKP